MPLARIPRAVHARRTAKRIHHQAAVIGKNRIRSCNSKHLLRLLAGIRFKRVAILHHIDRDAGIPQGQNFIKIRRKDRLDFRNFMRVVGCDNKLHLMFSVCIN